MKAALTALALAFLASLAMVTVAEANSKFDRCMSKCKRSANDCLQRCSRR